MSAKELLYECESVSYVYPDGTPALREVSFRVWRGDRVAILGVNGSGKSTLLRLLDGLLEPTSGGVRFLGTPLTERALQGGTFGATFRQRVGFVFQDADAQLFNPTVWDEVAFAPRQLGLPEEEVRARVADTLNLLGITHLAERAPFRLSGGEKRQVAIACVLSMNPEVLLMDEPIAGLDPRMQVWLVDILKRLHEAGKTLLVATHNLHLLPEIADRVLLLSAEHTVLMDAPLQEALQDVSLLVQAGLLHEHVHAHGAIVHSHLHGHEHHP
ncbi:MAG: ABC transporter ATP-binding protein [Armatimonadota bacterium]|nr:energy-coupling factor ABC transporter ATP-binding protein [bacterium]MCS7310698.1 energy-coupling factor ABC transporter ATP-binding protein [Armatimonadota bacterium]MDW8105013.1 ABC transporter ATP-binding protein [Armatimonadota bacterium]MDW8290891.1 ABC transporter ATP-binding protein [Armatimonadota bacterium]